MIFLTAPYRIASTTFAALILLALMSSGSHAQQSYASPEDAAAALAVAVKSDKTREILKVLGRAEDIVESGDEVADAETRKAFISAYETKHSIKAERNKKASLVVGAEDFPFPIPLVNTKSGWEFDADDGRIEILYRRIGRNELDAIQTCLAYVDAQNEYAAKDHGDGVGVYAQRIVSSSGKRDGLFWHDDSDPSPLGELVAQASAEGYKANGGPYHGYYFRVLTGQGPNAPGGALRYLVGGKMIGGFALLAQPAEYGNAGVMTFVVNQAGIVYQKDLGNHTNVVAKRISVFDPDQTWKKVDAPSP
jgi:hypothetical protein